MKKIPKTIIENRFDEVDNDVILNTTISFQAYDVDESLNVRIVLTNDYIQQQIGYEEATLNDLTEADKVVFARQRIAEWILFEDEPTPE